MRTMLKSKIHRATVTEANLEYEGSITIDRALMDAAEILPYQQVTVSNLNNGERFETYVLPGRKGSGTIGLNGPTARKGVPGDLVMIFCYEVYDEGDLKKFMPIIIRVDGKNQLLKG